MIDAPGEGKAKAAAAAEALFPGEKFRGPRGGIADGKADAALLAEDARRTYMG